MYKGVVYGTQLAIHFMRKNKVPGGGIISTASCAGVDPHETYPEYDGAKAAVRRRSFYSRNIGASRGDESKDETI